MFHQNKVNCFLIQEKYFQTANAVDTLPLTLHACFCATRTTFFLFTLKQMFPGSQQLPHLCPCPDNVLRQLVSYLSCHLTIVFLFQACPLLSAEQLYQRRPQTPVCRLPPVLCACCASLYWCSCIFTAFARVPAWICIGS